MDSQPLVFENELESLLSEDLSSIIEREKTSFDRTSKHFDKEFVIFGAGNLGKQISAKLRMEGIESLGFSDNNPKTWGTVIDGMEVFSPEHAGKKFGGRATFIVAIWNPESSHQFRETKQMLNALQCQNAISFIPFMWKYPDAFLPNCFLDLPHKIIEAKKDVQKTLRLWADDESRVTYLSQLKWRMIENYDALPSSTPEPQYFPGFLRLSGDEVFIDCGAYDGDSLRGFLGATKNRFKAIHAFEPDIINFKQINGYVKSLPAAENIHLHENAVGLKAETLKFEATGTASSVRSEAGMQEVSSISLDEVLRDEDPTFIKMDIEGAEIEALLGAEKLIRKYNPTLAICVYHKQNHLWEIPQLIASMSNNYHFFLRAHKEEGWDVVCYAIPPNRIDT